MGAFNAVDDGVGLEEVLCDGCYTGRVGATVERVFEIRPRLARSTCEDDGGVSQTHDGPLAVAGVWYRFTCHLFVDRSGARFPSDVAEFEPVEWRTRLAVPS